MIKNKFSFYLRSQGFLNYLRYLKIFYLKKTVTPFLYAGTGYLFYAFIEVVLEWNFPGYPITHTVVNTICLIILIQTSSAIFASLYQTNTSLQEYSIPVSMEERFVGNLLFYGVVTLSLVYIIHTIGYGIMLVLGTENSDEYTSHLWGNYSGVDLKEFLTVYLYFFAGSCFFRKSPIAKSLLLLVAVLIGSEFGFLYFDLSQLNLTDFSYGGSNTDLAYSYQPGINQDTIQTVIYYLLLVGWVIGGYFKLRNSQFRT